MPSRILSLNKPDINSKPKEAWRKPFACANLYSLTLFSVLAFEMANLTIERSNYLPNKQAYKLEYE